MGTVCKLRTLGMRPLHAAHTHKHSATDTENSGMHQKCSRFFVEKPDQLRVDELSNEELEAFKAQMIEVLKDVYQMHDASKFIVRPVSIESLQAAKAQKEDV